MLPLQPLIFGGLSLRLLQLILGVAGVCIGMLGLGYEIRAHRKHHRQTGLEPDPATEPAVTP